MKGRRKQNKTTKINKLQQTKRKKKQQTEKHERTHNEIIKQPNKPRTT